MSVISEVPEMISVRYDMMMPATQTRKGDYKLTFIRQQARRETESHDVYDNKIGCI